MQISKEENFDAGRHSSTFEVIEFGYLSLPYLPEPILTIQSGRIQTVNSTFFQMLKAWESILDSNGMIGQPAFPNTRTFSISDYARSIAAYSPSSVDYHFLAESLIFNMRRFFETHLHIMQIITHKNLANEPTSLPEKIQYDQLSNLFYEKTPAPDYLRTSFFGDTFEKSKEYEFIDLLNRLGNGMRHQAFFSEAYTRIGQEAPTILGLETVRNKIDKPIYHNHNAYHIMMGFQDTAKKVLERTKSLA